RPDDSIDEESGQAAILAALDSGVRLIDTASSYVEGVAEKVVGDALKARPELAGQVVVQTKVRDREVHDFHYSEAETRRSVETSLRRLQLAHIPMIYIHDPAAELFDVVMGAGGALQALRKMQS